MKLKPAVFSNAVFEVTTAEEPAAVTPTRYLVLVANVSTPNLQKKNQPPYPEVDPWKNSFLSRPIPATPLAVLLAVLYTARFFVVYALPTVPEAEEKDPILKLSPPKTLPGAEVVGYQAATESSYKETWSGLSSPGQLIKAGLFIPPMIDLP
jgi:hypothetical protein